MILSIHPKQHIEMVLDARKSSLSEAQLTAARIECYRILDECKEGDAVPNWDAVVVEVANRCGR